MGDAVEWHPPTPRARKDPTLADQGGEEGSASGKYAGDKLLTKDEGGKKIAIVYLWLGIPK